jgi:hypothetical protein
LNVVPRSPFKAEKSPGSSGLEFFYGRNVFTADALSREE